MKMLLQQHQKGFAVSFSALLVLLAMSWQCCCAHNQYIVGDSAGWVIPPYPTYYTNWSHNHFFRLGDFLEFNFDPKFYNLMEVTQYEYEHCTSMEPLKVFNTTPAIIQLNQRGSIFFVCSISNYCCLGQKLAVAVHQRNQTKPPSPSPSRISPPSQAPAPPPNGTAIGHSPPSPLPPSPSDSNGSDGNNPSSNKPNNAVALLVGGTSLSVHLLMPLLLLGFWLF
ncbi:hypothetical protein PIB30_036391 [Stylosanthes scabra]|uniref:Phytocyanin domain-containing protein n=1 Tax=Stylosanthes scabra TaxID=79078 RepID=A0ABU6QCU4_9FABA|nr:hypothetical protein [Stylosanthes scabra]